MAKQAIRYIFFAAGAITFLNAIMFSLYSRDCQEGCSKIKTEASIDIRNYNQIMHSSAQKPPPKNNNPNIVKKFLFWTTFFRIPWTYFEGRHSKMLKCGEHTCEIAQNLPYAAKDFDALVFHTKDHHNLKLLSQAIPKRNPKQIYIAFAQEPPVYQRGDFDEIVYVKGDNFYNWSVSMNSESTVQAKYSTVQKLKDSETSSSEEVYNSLKKLNPAIGKNNSSLKVFGVISHCNTHGHRENYIDELKKHVDVDIYGTCGTKEIPREGHWSKYIHKLGLYKFYLAFENSACKDYITEKLYGNAYPYGFVPIVYGGLSKEDYAKPGVAPPHSYIDTRDFKSPKDLAKYLEVLNKNDDLFMRYHEWRRNYRIGLSENENFFCGICHALHNKTLTSKPTTLNWETFYDPKKLCDSQLDKKLIP